MTYRTYREQKWWAMTDEERRDALIGECLGYRRGHFLDTGYVYAPYIPLMTTYIPKKFQQRWAKSKINPDFYGKITIMYYDKKYWYKKIEDIMNHFDFNKTHQVMEALDWEWVGSNVIPPDVEDLRKEVRRLLTDLVEDRIIRGLQTTCRECGGFRVEINVKEGYLSLSFIATSWESFDEDNE